MSEKTVVMSKFDELGKIEQRLLKEAIEEASRQIKPAILTFIEVIREFMPYDQKTEDINQFNEWVKNMFYYCDGTGASWYGNKGVYISDDFMKSVPECVLDKLLTDAVSKFMGSVRGR
jgi:hypothetical protein